MPDTNCCECSILAYRVFVPDFKLSIVLSCYQQLRLYFAATNLTLLAVGFVYVGHLDRLHLLLFQPSISGYQRRHATFKIKA